MCQDDGACEAVQLRASRQAECADLRLEEINGGMQLPAYPYHTHGPHDMQLSLSKSAGPSWLNAPSEKPATSAPGLTSRSFMHDWFQWSAANPSCAARPKSFTACKPADKLPRRRTLAASLQRVKPLNSRVSISTSHSIFADFVRSTYRLRKGRFERREPVLSELGRVRSHLHGGTSGHEDA